MTSTDTIDRFVALANDAEARRLYAEVEAECSGDVEADIEVAVDAALTACHGAVPSYYSSGSTTRETEESIVEVVLQSMTESAFVMSQMLLLLKSEAAKDSRAAITKWWVSQKADGVREAREQKAERDAEVARDGWEG